MAKRKTARPASRTRAPGAARAGKERRARTTSGSRRPPPRRSRPRRPKPPPLDEKDPAGLARPQARADRDREGRDRSPAPTARRRGHQAGRSRARRPVVPAREATGAGRTAAGPERRWRSAQAGRRVAGAPRASRRARLRPAPADRTGSPASSRKRCPPRPRRSTSIADPRPPAAAAPRWRRRCTSTRPRGPALTAGDVDADWEAAYNTGDEAPGGDMPTPDQAVVERDWHGDRRRVRGQRGTEGRRQDRAARPPPLGARSRLVRGLPGPGAGDEEG